MIYGCSAVAEQIIKLFSRPQPTHPAWIISGENNDCISKFALNIASLILADVLNSDNNSLIIENSKKIKDILTGVANITEIKSIFPNIYTKINRLTTLVSKLNHPDLLYISDKYEINSNKSKNTSSITIEEARKAQNILKMRNAISRSRVVIVDKAENMTLSALNSLLKSVEEPGILLFFILLSEKPHNILRTMHSRCLHFKVNSIKFEEMQDYLAKQGWILDAFMACEVYNVTGGKLLESTILSESEILTDLNKLFTIIIDISATEINKNQQILLFIEKIHGHLTAHPRHTNLIIQAISSKILETCKKHPEYMNILSLIPLLRDIYSKHLDIKAGLMHILQKILGFIKITD